MIAATQIAAITLAITIAAGSAMAGPVINAADQPSRTNYSSPTQQTAPVELPPDDSEETEGWKHGDTEIIDGITMYFHQGMGTKGTGAFIDFVDWGTWGPFPQAHDIQQADGSWVTDGSFLWEDARAIDIDGKTAHWCVQEMAWVTDFSWEEGGWHDQIHPGWKQLVK